MGLGKFSPDKQELSAAGGQPGALHLLNKSYVFDLLVILICLMSSGCSWIESMVNLDSFDWGFMYGPAMDLKNGAIPYSETFICYGYLTTWIQSISLAVFGERLMSLGIMTGVFYSLSLFLCYRIFLKFMPRSLAFIAVLLIFLIHPYMIYPASNYFVYTFQLLALIFFLKYSESRYNGFLAGFFLSLSLLARYTAVQAVLPPFILLLGWEYYTAQGTRKHILEKMGIVSAGLILPLLLFVLYLATNAALNDLFYQMQKTTDLWSKLDNVNTYLNFLAYVSLLDTSAYAYGLRGRIFSFILLVCVFIIVREIIRRGSDHPAKSADTRHDIIAVCLVSVFGYLNSIHVYETFRLVNGSSLGIGVVVFAGYVLFRRSVKPVKYLIVLSGILVGLFLSSSLFFQTTSSSYFPWRKDVLFHDGVTNENIPLLKGKLLTRDYNDFYQDVYDTIAPFRNTCHIINYTTDGVAFLMNDLPRVQMVPNYMPWFEDVDKQVKLIAGHEAVILSPHAVDFPGYQEIWKKNWPDEIPWLGGNTLFIYAPQKYAGNKATLLDRLGQQHGS